MKKYNPAKIEKKWQRQWEKKGTYRQYGRKKKCYVLDMFPYPSGAGLHVGHPKGYIATDVVARMKQLQGYGVLHPMGWDAFGLPAEQYAIKNKLHPSVAVKKNIATFKKQLEKIGFTYDWEREINTSDPEYYRFTQWIFLQLWKKGLAYESNEPIIWCPSCKTGLANEDLENGKCERCGSVVEKRPLRQWVLAMTKYADRLLKDLDLAMLEWPESIKEQQRNWIGRSVGTTVKFSLVIANRQTAVKQSQSNREIASSRTSRNDSYIEVFTTRVDTIFGCTYVVISPEHPLVSQQLTKNSQQGIKNAEEVGKYIKNAASKSDLERTELAKEKTGVKLEGIEAVNPFNGEAVPVFVADYVLGSYGTGAVMAVPAHDTRDWEFAKKYRLPIKRVVEPRFVATGDTAPKSEEPFVRREAVAVVVRNPEDDTYLCVSWKTTFMHGLVTGGIEPGESAVEAARREVREETGYKNLRLMKESDTAVHCLFHHRVKHENRWARFRYVFFDLENEERDPVEEKEASLHDVVWKKKAEFKDFFSVFEADFILELLDDQEYVYTSYDGGILHNSGLFSDLTSAEAREQMTAWLVKNRLGAKKVHYKMRDWTFSRQRYWGEPIPLIHCEKCGVVPVPEKELPLVLPNVKSYEPTGTGESPLANIAKWVNVKCPKCKGKARRETNTMPQWAGSSWYYLRFIDSKNKRAIVDKKKEQKMMPVDLYVGGTEHATRHLLYARFWHKFLYDIKVVSGKEPFKRLENQGLILASDGRKMSKRWGNVINPDDMIAQFGADAFRLYEMFMGPFGQSIAWNTDGVVGTYRFLDKVWKLGDRISNLESRISDKKITSLLHRTIQKVTEDIGEFKFNTAVSSLMILVNALEKESQISLITYQTSLILLSPFAPHITEELWTQLGNRKSIFLAEWPKWDKKKIVEETVTIAVQVNGKVRATIEIAAESDEEIVKTAALAEQNVQTHIAGKAIRKVIYVPGKIVNIVV